MLAGHVDLDELDRWIRVGWDVGLELAAAPNFGEIISSKGTNHSVDTAETRDVGHTKRHHTSVIRLAG
jgi:hypothetical protein